MISFTSAAQNARSEKETGVLEIITFRTYPGGVIAIEAKVGENPLPLNFILDTGSSGISLDSSTCAELKIPVKPTDTTVSGIAGVKKVAFVFDKSFRTGNLVSEHMNFYVNDYSLLSSTYGEKVDGIIGYSFLSRYIVHINFDSALIKIYNPGVFEYEPGGTILRPAFTKLAAQTVTVSDKNKTTFKFYLDTGAGLCLLMSESLIQDSSILLSRRKPLLTQAEGLGGKKSMRVTTVKRIKIGPYKFKKVPVYLYNDDLNMLSYPSTGGLIGNDIMRRFNITLNYQAGEIHIIPNGNYRDEFDYTYTGMSLYDINRKIIIDDIVPDSPAEKAGLKNGDEMVSVANTIFGTLQEYKNRLQKNKSPVKIIIKRQEKFLFISLQPLSIL